MRGILWTLAKVLSSLGCESLVQVHARSVVLEGTEGQGMGGGVEEVAKRSAVVMEWVTDSSKRGCVPQPPGDV